MDDNAGYEERLPAEITQHCTPCVEYCALKGSQDISRQVQTLM